MKRSGKIFFDLNRSGCNYFNWNWSSVQFVDTFWLRCLGRSGQKGFNGKVHICRLVTISFGPVKWGLNMLSCKCMLVLKSMRFDDWFRLYKWGLMV